MTRYEPESLLSAHLPTSINLPPGLVEVNNPGEESAPSSSHQRSKDVHSQDLVALTALSPDDQIDLGSILCAHRYSAEISLESANVSYHGIARSPAAQPQ